MKNLIFISLFSICLFSACFNKQNGGISKDTVQSIVEQIKPKAIDYEAMNAFFVISPDMNYIFVLESEKEKAIETLQAEVLSEFKWEIQLDPGEKHISIVNYVGSVSEFKGIYPVLIAYLRVGVDRPREDCIGKVEKNTIETAPCKKIKKGSYVKNVYPLTNNICVKVDTNTTCRGILTVVGTQYFYGDDFDCACEPIGQGEIWEIICL